MSGITTQAQFEQALANPNTHVIVLSGSGEYWVPEHLKNVDKHIKLFDYVRFTPAEFSGTVEARNHTFVKIRWGRPIIHAWDYSFIKAHGEAQVEARGSSKVIAFDDVAVDAYGSVAVTAYEYATVNAHNQATVTAMGWSVVAVYDFASVWAFDWSKVTARMSAHVVVYDMARVKAGALVAVYVASNDAEVRGGVQILCEPAKAMAPDKWCAFNLIEVDSDGMAHLYKVTDDNGVSEHGGVYVVGQTIDDTDNWVDDRECGHGLHASPTPEMARTYCKRLKGVRFFEVTCHVSELRPLDTDKCKAPRLHVLREVNEYGEPLCGR
jgi:hypothetical protein